MKLSKKYAILLNLTLLLLIVFSAYLQWPIAIIITACLALILVDGLDKYQHKISIKRHQQSHQRSEQIVDKLMAEMFVELEKTLSCERKIIDNEIKRTTKLLAQAVSGMDDSFQKMKSINDQQHDLFTTVLQMPDTDDNHQVNSQQSVHQFLEESSTIINDYVNELSEQVLSHLAANKATIINVDHIIDEVDAMVATLKENNQATLFSENIARVNSLVKLLKTNLGNPQQQALDKVTSRQSASNLMTQRMKLISATMEQNIVKLATMSADMDNAVFHAVISLQFEDMTSQALASISSNIEKFDAISQQVHIVSQNNDSISDKINEIKAMCLSVNEHTINTGHHRTVSQETMEEGEVELF